MNTFQWTPTIIAIATVIGTAFVANATLNRHDRDIETLKGKVQDLETALAVLKATSGKGGGSA